ncbi:MAG: TonB-dependent receptor [Microscillaceae bacterium]|nr:TonB-dependent receptor [Microscillaceae bacterium]MDW8460193.1 TonB-dependent receptor [Cytophagales bacterium]
MKWYFYDFPLCFLLLLSNCLLLQAQTDSLKQPSEAVLMDELLNLMGKQNTQSLADILQADVITTSRTNVQKNSKAPATIYIITAEQIRQRNYLSLADVLQDLPDVKIENAVDPRWMNDVTLRGIHRMDRFIILLDGVRISSPTNDVIPVIENYPVNFAKQVEVVFGPASALYGADAFSGVINIISQDAQSPNRTHINLQGGMYETVTGGVATTKKFTKDIYLSFGGQYHYDALTNLSRWYPQDFKGMKEALQTNQFNTVFGTFGSTEPVHPSDKLTPLSAYALHAKLQVKKLSISFFRNGSISPSTYAGNPNNVVYNQGSLFGHNVSTLSAVYNQTWGRWQSTTFLIGSRYDLNPNSVFRNVYTGLNKAYLFSYGRMWKFEQLFSYNLSSKIDLSAGITYEDFFSIPRGHDLQYPTNRREARGIIIGSRSPLRPEGIEADIPKIPYGNVGGFAQLLYKPTEKISFTTGSRFDYNTRYGSTFNPRLGIVWEVNKKTTLKTLYGSAFLAPSPLMAYDQFGTFFTLDNGATYQSAFFRLPNPNLKPQTVQTFELGISSFLNNNIGFSVNAYYSLLEGLFAYASDALTTQLYDGTYKGFPVGFIEVTINQGRQRNFGGTVQVDYLSKIGSKGRVTGFFALSYVEGNVIDTQNGKKITQQASAITPLMFRWVTDVHVGKWTLSPRLQIVSKQRTFTLRQPQDPNEIPTQRQTIKGYTLLNLSVNYHLRKDLTFFIIGKNLFDVRYYNVNLGASPESTLTGAAAQAELAAGAPQNPIRILGGVNITF